MQSVSMDNRFIFRAEIRSSRDTVISYGFDLTASSIFVVTDWLPPEGTRVSLRISFPSVLAPLDVAARVEERRMAGAPGEPSGVRLVFEVETEDARRRLAEILERLRVPVPDAEPPRAYRVLLVEDNSFIRDMFAYGIGKFFRSKRGSLVVEHAEDAASAWEKLSQASYDLAIID
jgi:CheY-like chemotaxis protein